MKSGKISQAVYDRSVFRPLKRSGRLDPGVFYGADSCSFAAVSCGPVCGPFDPFVSMRIAEAVNNLAVDGVKASDCRILTGITVPAGIVFSEDALKDLVTEIGDCCACWNLTLAGGHTECSDALTRPVLTVSAYVPDSSSKAGTAAFSAHGSGGTGELFPGWDFSSAGLYMAGRAGFAGSAVLAENFREKLRERFPLSMIDAARMDPEDLFLFKKAAAALEAGAVFMKDVSRGGIFGALWEFAGKLQCGFEVDLKKIPIRQETIEICEYFDLNPYQLYGQGAILAVVPEKDGERSCAEGRDLLRRAGFQRIGRLSTGRAKIIRNGEEIRYLENEQQDALNLLAEREQV
jgi:hydrogenase maturation factor